MTAHKPATPYRLIYSDWNGDKFYSGPQGFYERVGGKWLLVSLEVEWNLRALLRELGEAE